MTRFYPISVLKTLNEEITNVCIFQVSDDAVIRVACGAVNGECCYFTEEVGVKNCGRFLVYYLQGTPGCSYAYCTRKLWNLLIVGQYDLDLSSSLTSNRKRSIPVIRFSSKTTIHSSLV